MPFIFCYTRPGVGKYPDTLFPGHTAWLCDWEQSMHLAWSPDGKRFSSLRNNTGILFPRASFDEGDPKGTTKTLADPWLFRTADGSFGVCAVRRNQNAPDSVHPGSIMFFSSRDLVRFEETGFLRVSDSPVSRPACFWDPLQRAYTVSWSENGQAFSGLTDDFSALRSVMQTDSPPERAAGIQGLDEAVQPGNVLEITESELSVIRRYLDEIRHIAVRPMEYRIPAGQKPVPESLPQAECLYSDGSVHRKQVLWDMDALRALDTRTPGVRTIPGRIRTPAGGFPMTLNFGPFSAWEINDPNMYTGMSDPCVTRYRGKYYLSSSGNQHITLRCADTLEDVFRAPPTVIYDVELHPGEPLCGTWAAELHEIGGSLYLLTALCRGGDWTTVQAAMLRCHGDPMLRESWEEPKLCVRQDGGLISERGISLDMTYFEDAGRHYVMWSNRLIYRENGQQIIEPAEVDIASVDPARPWILTSPRICVSRPDYGWDRMETEVDEAPYLLRQGENLFVTISGSSTGMGDLYDVGLLKARSGTDLLDPASWDKLPYPILTKESVPGEFGPGHNNFVVDHRTGDVMMVYHAIPHVPGERKAFRQPGFRRVHFGASGLPFLEMTPERDLDPRLAEVTLSVIVE